MKNKIQVVKIIACCFEIIGFVLLVMVNWKIFLGIFLLLFSKNIFNKYDR